MHLICTALCICMRFITVKKSLVMDGNHVKEVETLSVLRFHFDHRLTWLLYLTRWSRIVDGVWDVFAGF